MNMNKNKINSLLKSKNKNINIADFCDENKKNKKYLGYYNFLNKPMNIFITMQYMKYLYHDKIKKIIEIKIKENKKEIKKNIDNAKIIMHFYKKNAKINNSPIGKFFYFFNNRITNIKVDNNHDLLKLFYEIVEYPELLSIIKECFYIFSNYRACLFFMTPDINFYHCKKEEIDLYIQYFKSNQNSFISILSNIYLGDKNPFGSKYYSTAYAMFETLNIISLYFPTKNYNVLKLINISNKITLKTKNKKEILNKLLKKFKMNKINKNNIIAEISNVSQFIIILKKMGYDMWFIIPLIFDTLYKYDLKGIQESNVFDSKKIYHQKINLKIGVMCYILKIDGFITNIHILNNFND